jgi:hypothetical protein
MSQLLLEEMILFLIHDFGIVTCIVSPLSRLTAKLVSVAEGSLLSIMSIGIRFLKRHIISVMSKSFDEGFSENNTIKIKSDTY